MAGKTLKDLAKEAIDAGGACNLSGVVHSFSRCMTDLRAIARAEGWEGSVAINRHPIAIVWGQVIDNITGCDQTDAWHDAFTECKRIAEGPDGGTRSADPDAVRVRAALDVIRRFAHAFMVESDGGLYRAGYADAWQLVRQSCDAALAGDAWRAIDASDVAASLAYVQGYARAAQLGCPYMGGAWCVGEAVERASGMLRAMLLAGDTAAAMERNVDTWTREIRAEMERREREASGAA
jgi:hypothetical protein